ncbi:unnamed protein product [Urochloa humidicola]
MRSAAGGDAAGEGVIPGVNCSETGQLGEPDGRDGDKRMEPKSLLNYLLTQFFLLHTHRSICQP